MRQFLIYVSFIGVGLLLVQCKSKEHFQIGFYNVENLFDTLDNPHKRDNDFLPEGKKKWDTEKYHTKIENIAQVIDSLPNVIFLGLCEVENKHVLADLKATQRLYKKGYSIIHQDSPDGRGIDIAAFYKADFFELIKHHYYRVKLPGRKNYSTRDLLYVKGLPFSKDTLHIFVNHWPSRYGGQEKTNPDRMHVAQVIAQKMDSIRSYHSDAQFIVMGDLNDTPKDSSVQWLMQKTQLKNQALNLPDSIGTYNYRGSWDVLDHIMYSENLEKGKSFSIQKKAYQIYNAKFIQYQKKDGSWVPNRTFGYRYYGGYSDHFPVYLTIGLNK